MSPGRTTLQPGSDLFTRVRVAAASGALFGTAAPPIFAKTPEECNAKYGANQDGIKASPLGQVSLRMSAFRPASANAPCHRRIVSSSNKSTVATSAFAPGALLGEDRLFAE
jgi:hypothetical protein